MSEPTTPTPRWFRFGLRTAFVAFTVGAIPFGWICYQLNWISQRHVFLAKHSPARPSVASNMAPPLSLSLFGETGNGCIYLDPRTNDLEREAKLAHYLFPEASEVLISELAPANQHSVENPF